MKSFSGLSELDIVMKRKRSFLSCILWESCEILPNSNIFSINSQKNLCFQLVFYYIKDYCSMKSLLKVLKEMWTSSISMDLKNFISNRTIRRSRLILKMIVKFTKPFSSKWIKSFPKKWPTHNTEIFFLPFKTSI